MTSRLWLRATEHVVVVDRVLKPGECVEFNDSAQHRASVDDMRAGRPSPLELVECETDPSLALPEAPPEFSYTNTLAAEGEPVYGADGTTIGRRIPGAGGATGEALKAEMARGGLRDDLVDAQRRRAADDADDDEENAPPPIVVDTGHPAYERIRQAAGVVDPNAHEEII